MPLPYRPPTSQSTPSWWSDRNSLGPNISIHAAAKPLIRLMYREQVRSFVKKNRETPLSRTTMDIYLSYLGYKYISPETKTFILNELTGRAEGKNDACVVAQSLLQDFELVGELLDSNSRLRAYTCNLLGTLASWYEPEILETTVSLASDVDTKVRQSALYALAKIVESPAGAQAIRETKMWDHFPPDLAPIEPRIRELGYKILTTSAVHETRYFWELRFSQDRVERSRSGVYRLSRITFWSQGAEAVAQVRPNPWEFVLRFLDSSDNATRQYTCEFPWKPGGSSDNVDSPTRHGCLPAGRGAPG
ncbi:hypothetical protein B0H16DRAFT_898093 [Mycena metata]|uniref:HEAT repeat domain-containing protein n=1 Tax=Mycena metata TaxID=1033252 RepID=A0AAD7N6N5_9AGAR|nr:hypothetical protein B0H16DRAFT_898093 [Mycena metata]